MRRGWRREFVKMPLRVPGDFSVLNVLGNANLNGFLEPVLLNGFVP